MNHTLKTLLTTTLLTLPTAFGSAEHAGAVDSDSEQLTYVTRALPTFAPTTSTLGRFERDLPIIGRVVGHRTFESFEVGFLDMKNVSNLCLVSSGFNAFAQPVLDRAKAWKQTNIIPKLLQSAPFDPEDQKKINFLGISTDASFYNILKTALNVKFWIVLMSDKDHAAYVSAINGNAMFSDPQKQILRGLLPNATPEDILGAAESLGGLGSNYHDRAEELFERFASHPTTTPQDIRATADEIQHQLGHYPEGSEQRTRCFDRAKKLLRRSACRPDATPYDIQWAAVGIMELYAYPYNPYPSFDEIKHQLILERRRLGYNTN
jgi:hypothetical protein